MKLSYFSEQYKTWMKVNSITFERKLENETAFDGIVKIYSLKCSLESVSQMLNGNFFGEFSYSTETGILLRMFTTKYSWPKSTLIYIDLINFKLTEIDSNNSSWLFWKVKDLKCGKYSVQISPSQIIQFQT